MPTYDYVCETCGNRFEEWQKITDEPTKICPACGGPVHRVIYPVGLVFKGSGFYKTDNRAATPAAESSTAIAAKDKETSGGDGKAAAKDSKSEATKTSAGGEAAAPTSAASKSE